MLKNTAVARHRVREQLQDMILNGRLSPGSRLAQQRLARRFGVAQGVVRESLFELHACGLVDMADGFGATVSKIETSNLINVFHIREALEGLAARLCCETASRADLTDLEQQAAQVDEAGVSGQLEEMAQLDHAFHQRLVELTNNPMLVRLSGSYRTLAKMVRLHVEGDSIPPEHVCLLEPIRDNDPDRAEQMMREHIRRGTDLLKKILREGPESPIAVAAVARPQRGRRRVSAND